MPGLISSSSSAGPRAAPKAAARRRPQTLPGHSAKHVTSASSNTTSFAPPSPPPTQSQQAEEPSVQPRSSLADGNNDTEGTNATAVISSFPQPTEVSTDAARPRAIQQQRAEQHETLEDGVRSTRQAGEGSGRREGTDHSTRSTEEEQRLGVDTRAIPLEHVQEGFAIAPAAESTVLASAGRAEGITAQGTPSPRISKRSRTQPQANVDAPPAKKVKRSTATRSPNLRAAAEQHDADSRAEISSATHATNTASDAVDEQTRRIDEENVVAHTGKAKAKSKRPGRRGRAVVSSEISGEETRIAPESIFIASAPNANLPKPVRARKTRGKSKTAAAAASAIGDTRESSQAADETRRAEDAPTDALKKPARKRNPRRSKATEAHASGKESRAEDDHELHEIDPKSLSMWALSYDTVNGQVSELGKKMAEIDWDEVKRKRHLEEQGITVNPELPPGEQVVQSVEGQEGQEDAALERLTRATPGPATNDVDDADFELQMDADGNIIVNDDALVRVQNAEAEAAANSDIPVTEDNPITSTFNRTTYINANRRDPADRVPMWRGKSDPWSEEETERFYQALRMFGTDFFIISKMFAPKTRKMIKAKFTREERLDPARVNHTLMGLDSRPMDLEHYARETGRDVSVFTKYSSIEEASAAIRQELEPTQADMTAAIEQEAADAEKEAQEKAKRHERNRVTKRVRRARREIGFGMGGGGPPDDADA